MLAGIEEFRQQAADRGLGDVVDRYLLGPIPNTPKTGMKPDDPAAQHEDDSTGGAGARDGEGLAGGDLSALIARRVVLASILNDGDGGNGNGNGHGHGAAAGRRM